MRLAPLAFALLPFPALAEEIGECRFDRETLTFAGTRVEQATCLLRKVKLRGEKEPQPLPPVFRTLMESDGAPSAAQKAATWKTIAKDFADWVYANHQAELHFCPLLGAYSAFGESQGDFRVRISQTARELRDKAVEELRAKMTKQAKSIEDKAATAMAKVETQKAQASSAKWSTAATLFTTALGAFFGRKGGLSTSVSKVGSVFRESKEAANAEQEVERYREELKALDQQLEDETQKIRDQYDPTALVLETAKLTPLKKNITTSAVGILWVAE